ncbi:uncharacterized protein LOC124366098 [Homalodisca vitripennis]|uniref:uncharacterized protein LOC124366098 n=1 Tax=Homalodisca vitripennis TaxID=197043 RepID=UPI001EEC7C38|nr:uncharacterized protein LOC124366098 [Homalodisca vitripennis]KAG8256449.1 hypothetical protein J6590_068191 [Homalodisca vitripennis]
MRPHLLLSLSLLWIIAETWAKPVANAEADPNAGLFNKSRDVTFNSKSTDGKCRGSSSCSGYGSDCGCTSCSRGRKGSGCQSCSGGETGSGCPSCSRGVSNCGVDDCNIFGGRLCCNQGVLSYIIRVLDRLICCILNLFGLTDFLECFVQLCTGGGTAASSASPESGATQ